MKIVRLMAAVALTATLAGCHDPLAPELERLEDAEARWSAAGPASYAYEYHGWCFCDATPVVVTVTGGEVTAAEYIGEPPPWAQAPVGWTVEQLFRRLRDALASDPHTVTIEYHPTLGYPLSASFDMLGEAVDDEWGFDLRAFSSLD